MKYSPILFSLLCVCLSACSSITPLKTKPPYSKISVNRPFTWGDGILTVRADMPAGTYTPRYEDDEGYYYEAPQKVTGRDAWMSLMMDGGLYLERNRPRPEKIYFIRGSYGVPAKLRVGNRADLTLHR